MKSDFTPISYFFHHHVHLGQCFPTTVQCAVENYHNFLSILFRYYFKSVLLVIMSVCGFHKYVTNEKHSNFELSNWRRVEEQVSAELQRDGLSLLRHT